jgi:hypothetical protein
MNDELDEQATHEVLGFLALYLSFSIFISMPAENMPGSTACPGCLVLPTWWSQLLNEHSIGMDMAWQVVWSIASWSVICLAMRSI